MRIVLSFFCLFLFPSLCCGAPAIDFRNLSYDLGTVRQEDKVVHVFDFMNKGDQELIILKVSAS